MSTVSPATDTVLSTPELLEHILASLSIRYLLTIAPLVSKTWQAVALTPRLQRILFFQPDPASTSADPVQNSLLMELFPPFFLQDLERQSRWSWPNAAAIITLPWAAAPAAFRRPDASWRRMLVRQPPVRHLFVTETCHGQIGDSKRRAEVANLELRMGTLYDLVVPLIDRVASSFCIRWSGTDADLTLDVIFTSQCAVGRPSLLGEQFYTEGTFDAGSERIELDFGDWNSSLGRPLCSKSICEKATVPAYEHWRWQFIDSNRHSKFRKATGYRRTASEVFDVFAGHIQLVRTIKN
ncbi:hypothetical protein DFH06DRAFT_1149563 [Mycena polygramma]|nr:hypothetical protein DFH06DRAFT_1149563 [Mycena polygramma]